MFAVFAISKQAIRKALMKRLFILPGEGPDDYERRLSLAVDDASRVTEKTKRTRVSPEYSTPDICEEFIKEIQKRGMCGFFCPEVRVRIPKRRDDGSIVMRGGEVVGEWVRYDKSCYPY